MTKPIDIATMMPSDTPPIMFQAWLDCLRWAIGEPEIVAKFRAETGTTWTPGKTPLDRMIDDAGGAERGFVEAFVKWFNVNVWGPVDGPELT